MHNPLLPILALLMATGARACTEVGDCSAAVCNSVDCVGGACIYTPLPDGTPTWGVYHCLNGENVACIADYYCAALPCNTAQCNASHECVYTPLTDGVECDGGSCLSGACVECAGVEDCPASTECKTASCNAETHKCELTPLPDGTPTWGVYHCLDGENVACLYDYYCAALPCNTAHCNASHECVYTPLTDGVSCPNGMCLGGVCVGLNCVHPADWWYDNAATAVHIPIPVGDTVATGADEVRTYIGRIAGTNGLDKLAAAVLLVRLNVAAGAKATFAIAGSVFISDYILSVCHPNDPATWTTMLRSGSCGGHTTLEMWTYTAAMFAFSDGQAGVPQCDA